MNVYNQIETFRNQLLSDHHSLSSTSRVLEIIALRLCFSWIHSFQSFDWFLEWFWLDLILAFDLLLCRVTWIFHTKPQIEKLFKSLLQKKFRKTGKKLWYFKFCSFVPKIQVTLKIVTKSSKKTGFYIILSSSKIPWHEIDPSLPKNE